MRKRTVKRYGTYLAMAAATALLFTGCSKAGGDGHTGTEAVLAESRRKSRM